MTRWKIFAYITTDMTMHIKVWKLYIGGMQSDHIVSSVNCYVVNSVGILNECLENLSIIVHINV